MGNCFPADAPACKTTVSGGKLESRNWKGKISQEKKERKKKGVDGWGSLKSVSICLVLLAE